MFAEFNLLSIFLAAVVSVLIGFIWYSPFLFASHWMKLMGHTKDSLQKAQKQMQSLYVIIFVFAIVMAFVLSHFMSLSITSVGYTPLTTGLTTAFFVWLGFVLPVQVADVIFGNRHWHLFYINTGYQLVSLLAMGIVLALA